MYNGTIINDTITLFACFSNTISESYNAGFFIEGLSVYANITGNADWTTLYVF